MTLDPGRTRRALSLDVTELADSEYVATGGREPHTVATSERPWQCDCADARYGSAGRCKHTTAVYLAQRLHPAVRDALRSAVGAS